MTPSGPLISLVWALAGAGFGLMVHPMVQRLGDVQWPPGSAVPPTVALTTSVLFGLLAWRTGFRAELLAYSCIALVGVPLAAIDLAELRLPSRLILPACLALLALFALAAAVDHGGHALLRATGAMLTLPAAYLALAMLSRGGLGAGDVRLAALIGLALGWRSWTAVAVGTMITLGYACLIGLVAIALGRATRASPIPFGPAMIAGTFTVLLTPP